MSASRGLISSGSAGVWQVESHISLHWVWPVLGSHRVWKIWKFETIRSEENEHFDWKVRDLTDGFPLNSLNLEIWEELFQSIYLLQTGQMKGLGDFETASIGISSVLQTGFCFGQMCRLWGLSLAFDFGAKCWKYGRSLSVCCSRVNQFSAAISSSAISLERWMSSWRNSRFFTLTWICVIRFHCFRNVWSSFCTCSLGRLITCKVSESWCKKTPWYFTALNQKKPVTFGKPNRLKICPCEIPLAFSYQLDS